MFAVALAVPAAASARDVRVVVGLDGPGLAQSVAQSRVLTKAARERPLDLRSATSRGYLDDLAVRQASFEHALARAIPRARVDWRYRVVLNAVAVTLPESALPRLRRLPRVRTVYESGSYDLELDRSPGFIGAPQLWNDPLATRGDGIKIGIVDDGIDQTHPFFSPAGYAMPPGFPKGQTAYTTSKVIVARAFAPRGLTWRYARRPFDPELSSHATHVAGIAAGNANTPTSVGTVVSGVAPRAYLGNYKVMTIPSEVSVINGNAPEIVRGIEAAVADGMDVINLSIGQVEIEPARDIVAIAIDGAAAAGVVPVVSAGNEFRSAGRGSILSPASARTAITVGASEDAEGIAPFSSSGPTPLSLRLKPEVVAPGTTILSSIPGDARNQWTLLSGTSMAAPHVAGAAALLQQRHPEWTPAQVKAALVSTANPFRGESVFRIGGGLVDLPDADSPLVFAEPPTVSFGVVRPGARMRATVQLEDAGGGAGEWSVTLARPSGRTALAPVTVPGTLELSLTAPAANREEAGWVLLSRGGVERRIPYWFAALRPRLATPSRTLRRGGTYAGSTRGRPARVLRYRYPDLVRERTRGPEQVFRFVLSRAAANVGVAVTSGGAEPRILLAPDENRVAGHAALPVNVNSYDTRLGQHTPVAGMTRPLPRTYYLVFDSHTARGGPFTFRVWIGDTRPPAVRFLGASGGTVRFRVTDAGAGVDPTSLHATSGGVRLETRLRDNVASVDVSDLRPGTHTIAFSASDYQEAKNNENVAGRGLPNTRTLRVTVRVR